MKRKKKMKIKTLFHLETDFILRLLHGKKDGIINYADTPACIASMWKFVYKWPLCQGMYFPFWHKAPFYRNMDENHLFEF